jgi:hypothetical protein
LNWVGNRINPVVRPIQCVKGCKPVVFHNDTPHQPNQTFEGAEQNVSRDTLRIHEDGKKMGSAGCIALRPTQMESFWNRMKEIWDAMGAWGTPMKDRKIPLFVYDRTGLGNAAPNDSRGWGSGAFN